MTEPQDGSISKVRFLAGLLSVTPYFIERDLLKIKIKRYWFFLVPLIILTWTSSIYPQHKLYLSPLLVELDLAPGAKKHFTLQLVNESGEKSISLIAYPADINESRKGRYQILDQGESEYSCADWMELSDTSFTLEPGSLKEIKVQIKAPRNVFGGRYGAVVFEVVPEEAPPGEKLGSVRYHFRMPAFVEVTIKRFGGRVRKASISDLKVEPVADKRLLEEIGTDALAFSAAVENQGNIHVEGKGTLIIKNKEGKTKRRVPLGGGRGIVIPGATVDFRSFLRKPPAGEYIARAVINFGGLSPAVAEVPFTVTRTKSSVLGSFKASSFMALDIKPENLEMKVPQRGFRVVTFSFRNRERDTVEVKAYLKDLGYDQEGDLVMLDSSATGRSCTEWITLEPHEFSIAPDGGERVKLTLQAPLQGEGGYYACVVFDALLKGSKEGAISTPFQIPVILSVPPDLNKEGEIVDIKVEASAGRPATFTALFKNTGNIHLKPKGKIDLKLQKEIKSTEDLIVLSRPEYEALGGVPFEEVEQYVLPGGIRKMEAGYPEALEAGKYIVEVTIAYGGSEPVKFEKKFRVR